MRILKAKSSRVMAGLAVVGACLGAVPGGAWAADVYMKLGEGGFGCAGSVTTKAFAGQIAVRGFTAGAETPVDMDNGGTLSVGRVKFDPIAVVKPVDGCSGELFLMLATGRHYEQVTITFVEKNTPYLVMTLSLVIVSSLRGAAEGRAPYEEQVTFEFGAVRLTTPDREVCWNRLRNNNSCEAMPAL